MRRRTGVPCYAAAIVVLVFPVALQLTGIVSAPTSFACGAIGVWLLVNARRVAAKARYEACDARVDRDNES